MAANPETGFQGSSPNGAGSGSRSGRSLLAAGGAITATHAEITRAYRRAMKRVHPDRQLPERRVASEDLARRLNAAYTILADPLKRQAYDRTIRQQVIQDQIMAATSAGFRPLTRVQDRPGRTSGGSRPPPSGASARGGSPGLNDFSGRSGRCDRTDPGLAANRVSGVLADRGRALKQPRSVTTQRRRPNPDRDRIRLRECVGGHADLPDPVRILVKIGWIRVGLGCWFQPSHRQ